MGGRRRRNDSDQRTSQVTLPLPSRFSTPHTNNFSKQSHHPPVTAYSIRNPQHGLHLQGYNAQKATFGRRIDVRQVGHAELHLAPFNEDYLITLPPLHIEGLITGSPFVELNNHTFITSTSGYTARIEYSGRGWLSGKKNSFTASLYPTGKEKEVLYTVDGQWTGEFTIKDSKKSVVDTWKAKDHPTTPLKISPVEDQDELESRRAWAKVAAAIQKGDMNIVSGEKGAIENSQRHLRKQESEQGREWDRVFFSRLERSEVFEKLAGKMGESLEPEKTNGLWRFDETKAAKAQKPYRAGVLPPPPGLARTSTSGSTRGGVSSAA